MSDLRDHMEVGKPLTLAPHKVTDCLDAQECQVCQYRCNPQQDGHFFPGTGITPCICGRYQNLQQFERENPDE